MRMFILGALLAVSTPALACPMADAAAFTQAAEKVKASPGTKITLAVEGLSCGGCSETVTAALSALSGVYAAAIDYQTGRAEIAYDPAKIKVDALIAEIKKSGYAAKQNQS